MDKIVIWATDGLDAADRALATALELARPSGGRIVAVHVDQRLAGRGGGWPVLPEESELLTKIQARVDALHRQGVPAELLVRRTHHDPARVIAAIAEELDADAIVCGTHGRSALGAAVVGSVAHALIHVAPCPVVVVSERAAPAKVPVEMPAEAVPA